MPFTVVPDKASGDVFTEQMWDQYVRDNLNTGSVRPIVDSTLGGTAATVVFSSITASWACLWVVVYARLDAAITGGTTYVRMNGDTGSNYDNENLRGEGNNTILASEQFGQIAGWVGSMPGASAPANSFGMLSVFFPNYANTTPHKSALAYSGIKRGTTTGLLRTSVGGVRWRSTSAINSITVLSGGADGNFVAGSRFMLFGIGGLV